MTKRRLSYEPPLSRDLSDLDASGQETQGVCMVGYAPYTDTCQSGSRPSAIGCAVGQLPSDQGAACDPTGVSPLVGGCATGTKAQRGCIAGSFN